MAPLAGSAAAPRFFRHPGVKGGRLESTAAESPSLLAELKRRRVVRVVVAYGAVAFGGVQVLDPVFAGLMLPDFAFRIVVVAAIAGFPIVGVLAWVYDITAEGLRRTPPGQERSIVQRIPLLKGNPSLEKSVMETLSTWRFNPLPPNAPQEHQVGTITFRFRLE